MPFNRESQFQLGRTSFEWGTEGGTQKTMAGEDGSQILLEEQPQGDALEVRIHQYTNIPYSMSCRIR